MIISNLLFQDEAEQQVTPSTDTTDEADKSKSTILFFLATQFC